MVYCTVERVVHAGGVQSTDVLITDNRVRICIWLGECGVWKCESLRNMNNGRLLSGCE